MATQIADSGGTTASFSNTPQAQTDTYFYTEDYAIATNVLALNVMSNDLGGAAKTLYSIDDGISSSGIYYKTGDADLLTKDGVTTYDTSLDGAHIYIQNGQVMYDVSTLPFSLNSLAAGETYKDSFVYAIQLGNGTLAWSTVTLTFTGVNDAPVISVGAGDSDSHTFQETNAPLAANGTLTVVDPDTTDTVTASVTGASIAAGSTTGGLTVADLQGMLTITSAQPIAANTGDHNNLGWAFSSTPQAFDFLAVGEHLTVDYTVAVSDGHGGSDQHTVEVTITGTEDAPVISVGSGDSAAATLTETNAPLADGPHTLTVVDPDLSDSVTASVTGVVASGTTAGLGSNNAALKAMLSVASGPIAADPTDSHNLGWSFSSGAEAFDYLAAGEHLTLTYTVQVDDGHLGGTATQQVTVTVNGTEDAPVISVGSGDSAAATLTETNAPLADGPHTLTVVDPDASDSVTASVTGVVASGTTAGLGSDNAALKAMLSVASGPIAADPTDSHNLGWSFSSGAEAFDYLAAGEHLTLTYTVQVDDGHAGGTATQQVTVTVNGTEDAPVISVGAGDSAAAILTETNAPLADGPHTLTVVDPDASDSVTASVTGVVASGTTAGLGSDNAALKAMLSVASGPIAADPTDSHNLGWSFSSGAEAFDYLAAGEHLTLTYTVQVDDGHLGGTATQQVTVTVNGTEDAPVISVGAGDSASATLTETNAPLADGPHTLTVVDPDASDSVTASVTGVVASGTTAGLGSDNAALKAMLSVASGPIAADPTDSHNLGWSFSSGAEAFDYLAAGEHLTLTYTVQVDDGHAGGTATQQVTVTVNGTEDAPVISVGAGDSAAAILTETNAPLADGPHTLTVVDPDASDSVTASVTGVVASGTTAGLGSDNAALKAMLSVASGPIAADPTDSHNLGWSFSSGAEAFDYLAAGEHLTLTYTVQVDDGHVGGTATQQVTVTVNGTEDAPVISVGAGDSASATLTETNAPLADGPHTLTVVDPDASDSVTASVTGVVASGTTAGLGSDNAALKAMLSVASGSIAADPTDSHNLGWSFSSGAEAFDYLAAGEHLTLTYTVQVDDGHAGGTATQQVTVTVNGTEDAPVISVGAGDSAAAILTETNAPLADGPHTLTVVDPDLSDAVTASVTGVVASGTTAGLGSDNAALKAMLSVASGPIAADPTDSHNLGWSFSSGAEAFDYLAAGEHLTLTYTVQVDDGHLGGTATQQVTVTVNGTEDAPVISVGAGDSASATLTETNAPLADGPHTLTVVDPDASDSVTASVTGVVASGTTAGLGSDNAALKAMLSVASGSIAADPTDSHNLGWSFSSGAEAFDYLAAGEHLTLTYTVQVDDGHAGGTATQQVTVTVNGTEDAPVISVGSGDSASATLTETNAPLADGPHTLTVVDPDLSDAVTASVTGVVASGTTTGLGSDNAALKAMLSVASGPIAADPTDSHNLGWSFSSGAEAFDYLAAGEHLTLTYTVQVDDGHAGGTATQQVTVTVNGTEDAPVISVGAGDSASATLTETNAPLADGPHTLTVVDPDLSDAVTASVTGVVASGTTTGLGSDNAALKAMLSVASGPIAADPTDSHNLGWSFSSGAEAFDYLAAGEHLTLTYTVQVDDGHAGGTATQQVTVTVNGTEDAPVISVGAGDSASATLTETNAPLADGPHTLTVVDPDLSDAVTASVTGVVASGTTTGLGSDNAALKAMLSVASGPIAADPTDSHNLGWSFSSGAEAFDYLAAGEHLTLTYTVQVDDGHLGGTATQQVTVTVNGTEDAPVISVAGSDSDSASSAETNTTQHLTGTLTVVDPDASDTVTASVTGVSIAAGSTAGGLTAADLQGLLTVTSGAIAANPGDHDNLAWTFDSASQAFDFLAVGEHLTLDYTVAVDDGHGGSDQHTVEVTITGTNDAPVLDAGKSPALAAENEDAGAPSGAVGTLVSSLVSLSGGVANVSDADDGAVTGLALTGTNGANGVWYYSTDNGAHWSAVGAVSDSSALLLAADANTRLYFQPGANFNGGISDAVTFRAWDATSGAAGSKVDATTNGGTTAFSSAADTASLTVNAVDDAPVNTVPGAQTVNQGANLYITGLSIGDVDAGAGALTTTLSVGHGILTVASAGGAAVSGSGTGTVTLTGSVSQIDTTLAALNNVAYLASSYSGADTLTMTTNDNGFTGSGGPLSDTDTVGITVNAPVQGTATIAFAMDVANLSNLEASNTLHTSQSMGTISATDAANDTFTYSLGSGTDPSNHAYDTTDFGLSATGALQTLNTGSNGGTIGTGTYYLDVIATDNHGVQTSKEFIVWVGTSSDNSSVSFSGNTSVIAYGLNGSDSITGSLGSSYISGSNNNDTLSALNGTLVGGASGDSLTHLAGTGAVTFSYAAATDSSVTYKPNGSINSDNRDSIDGFVHGTDKIDLTALGVHFTGTVGALGGATIGHNSIGWTISGSNVELYVDTQSSGSEIITAGATYGADMQIHIHLSSGSTFSAADLLFLT